MCIHTYIHTYIYIYIDVHMPGSRWCVLKVQDLGFVLGGRVGGVYGGLGLEVFGC